MNSFIETILISKMCCLGYDLTQTCQPCPEENLEKIVKKLKIFQLTKVHFLRDQKNKCAYVWKCNKNQMNMNFFQFEK
jgi:hypothetical protein